MALRVCNTLTLRRLCKVCLAVVIFFVGASWFFAYDLTRARHRAVGPPPVDFPFPTTDVSWTTSDGETIHGWFMPAPETDAAVVLLHGYRGDRRSMLPRARLLREAGFAVLAYDARAC